LVFGILGFGDLGFWGFGALWIGDLGFWHLGIWGFGDLGFGISGSVNIAFLKSVNMCCFEKCKMFF
jgi:hypothetical protein